MCNKNCKFKNKSSKNLKTHFLLKLAQHILKLNIYFWLRFSLAINDYIRFKIRVVWVGNFSSIFINCIRHTKSESDLLFIYQNFFVQITFWICVLALWIPTGYFEVKKLVCNVRIKAFWYTNGFKKISWCCFLLKLQATKFRTIHIELRLYSDPI